MSLATPDRRHCSDHPFAKLETRVSGHSYAMVEDLVSKWTMLHDMTEHPEEWIELLQSLPKLKKGE